MCICFSPSVPTYGRGYCTYGKIKEEENEPLSPQPTVGGVGVKRERKIKFQQM